MINQLKSYQALLHAETELFIQAHGNTGTFALAFAGPEKEIEKWHNFFSNFDNRPKNKYDEFPKCPRLTYIGPRFAYINITRERLKEAFMMYFMTNIPLLKDVKSQYIFDEVTEESFWVRDEEEIARLANEASDDFINNQIKTHCFMPESFAFESGERGEMNLLKTANYGQ